MTAATASRPHAPPAHGRAGLPPGPPLPPAAQMVLWATRPHDVLAWCARRYGDAFTLRLAGFGDMVVVSAPEAIKQVFTADPSLARAGESNVLLEPVLGPQSVLLLDGAEHLRERRLLLPPFHGERMHAYATTIRDATDRALDRWPLGRPFALRPHFQSLTLEVILRAVFGVHEPREVAEWERLLARLADLGTSTVLFFRALQVDLGPRSPWGAFTRVRDEADARIFGEIARRRRLERAGAAHGDDVLTLLLGARDEHGEPMTDRELRDELVTLLMAGHETTANALAWTLERMMADGAVMARARDEVRAVLGAGPLAPAHLPRLAYLDAVVKESLRLRPVISVVIRRLAAPLAVGGYALPRGTFVAPAIVLTHLRPELYPEPHRFHPERWLGAGKPDPYAWLPFGGGARRCIGMAFAMYEMKVALATILARAELRPGAARPSREQRRGVTMTPHDGARAVLVSRAPRA